MGNKSSSHQEVDQDDYDEEEENQQSKVAQSQEVIDSEIADKIKLELAQISINYAPASTSVLGEKKDLDRSDQTEIGVEEEVRLLKFDTFLNLYTLVTKFAKQAKLPSLKSQRQELYRRADWEGYRLITVQQLTFEKEAHDAIMDFVLSESQVTPAAFSLSQQRYSLNRICAEQVQGSLASMNKVAERQKLFTGRKLLLAIPTESKPSREMTIEILKAIEKQKADTLSELSNPFKAARDKIEIVLDLEEAKLRISDFIEVEKGLESEELFWACCHHYGLMKSDEELNDPEREGLSRDALVIRNNVL